MPVTESDKIDNYYQALIDRNSAFTGIFYVGVKTTTVFCIATCRARKPKKENVEFFENFKEALQNGYRPCKVCKPTENANKPPEQVEQAIELVKLNPKEKISDYRLRQENISPDLVRRWFKDHYSMTFHSYQRMYRINNAYKELKEGKRTTDAAFDLGYESLSGFGYTYKKILGKSPAKSQAKNVVLIDRTTTPLGPMFICATEKGICLLEFTDRKMLETEFKDLQHLLKAEILTGENAHIKQVKRELNEYFEGKRTQFDVALDTPGTEFQSLVWEKLKQIPLGETTNYQALAENLEKPNAVRAVANANGHNRISIIVPCHRVIGKDGNLTGYGGGIERKKWLIEFEKKVYQAQ
ncbi:bifunctional transcriptional activator/DNA repair enzyme AdaA [Chondrinema litorale]|uniref:bifunctional transcriptional activator/DNA repair enzyme AdaA n=1 Tax=Chondrinema litorale TaxID=2994555 RepID=UPI002543EC61|nr:methylated-DNA--[protein]-cysteine S-methyltransferase [Chondrinema litorale]UZR97853.1 methylated-DNA--[protein]-cysteine S-methyltransferase [Chondrinema litorale]